MEFGEESFRTVSNAFKTTQPKALFSFRNIYLHIVTSEAKNLSQIHANLKDRCPTLQSDTRSHLDKMQICAYFLLKKTRMTEL